MTALDDLAAYVAADPARAAAWHAQARRVGFCAHPVRLVGSVSQVDRHTGEARQVFSSDAEPGGRLLVACGNRRETVCPACSDVYRGDAWQLISAGLRGGKGIPETVATHPALFVTLTAPSFGLVHSRRAKGRTAEYCLPRCGVRQRCRHGRFVGCWLRHDEGDPRLGEPLCPDCYNYEGLVVWNAYLPDLWRRTTIYLHRALARVAGMTVGRLWAQVRISYVKVAEYQARGAVHLHAVVRLDAAGPVVGLPPAPPPAAFTAALLEDALRVAVPAVSVPCPDPHDHRVLERPGRHARWGDQLDIRPIVVREGEGLTAEAVAAYIAKYATKSTDPLGRLDRRLRSVQELAALPVREHLARLVTTAWRLGGRPELAGLGLRQWAHAFGFRGHWSSKSCGYSTTYTVLRRARREHTRRQRFGGTGPLDAWGRPEDDDQVLVIATWRCVGVGYRDSTETALALASATWAREQRKTAASSAARRTRHDQQKREGPEVQRETYLTEAEAAAWMNVPTRFIRRLRAERRLPYVCAGRHVRIALSDLDTFMQAGRVEAFR